MEDSHRQPFTFRELRSIVTIGRSPKKLKKLAHEVIHLKSALRGNPDLSWTQYIDLFTEGIEMSSTPTEGEDILESTFHRFQNNRKAVNYWEKMIKKDGPSTTDMIRRSLDIPITCQIDGIQFLEDCVVLTMDTKNVNDYFRYLEDKGGEHVPKGLVSVGGFVSDELFLKNNTGNTCRVIIAEKSVQSIIPHEREHIVFREYLRREQVVVQKKSEEIRKIRVRADFVDKLKLLQKIDLENVSKTARMYLEPVVTSSKHLWFEETVAELTALYSMTNDDRVRDSYVQRILDYGPNQFDLATIDALWINHIYGARLAQTVDGMRDAIGELPNIPDKDKLKLGWEIEKNAATVAAQSRIISRWISDLWRVSFGNVDEFIALLEVIPYKYISTIGGFIRKDPTVLEGQLQNNNGQEPEIEKLSIWRMMARYVQESPTIQSLPDIKAHTDVMRNLLRKHCIHEGKLNIEDLYTTLQSTVVDQYLEQHKVLTESLYRECSSLFAQMNRSGIPVEKNKWLKEHFVRTYGLDRLNFQVIQDAIIALLVESGQVSRTDEVMNQYSELFEGARDRHNDVGIRIVREEQKLMNQLENNDKTYTLPHNSDHWSRDVLTS